MLNVLLDAEADRLCNAQRYERSEVPSVGTKFSLASDREVHRDGLADPNRGRDGELRHHLEADNATRHDFKPRPGCPRTTVESLGEVGGFPPYAVLSKPCSATSLRQRGRRARVQSEND